MKRIKFVPAQHRPRLVALGSIMEGQHRYTQPAAPVQVPLAFLRSGPAVVRSGNRRLRAIQDLPDSTTVPVEFEADGRTIRNGHHRALAAETLGLPALTETALFGGLRPIRKK